MERMTMGEALLLTLDKVDELGELGIGVASEPSGSASNPETVERYGGPGNVPPDLWVRVSFMTDDAEHLERIHDAEDHLVTLGVRFDTGGCYGRREWELDWSFTCNDDGITEQHPVDAAEREGSP